MARRRGKATRDALALKAGFWYTLGNFINKGLVFLTTPIFTRIMTKTEYGNYTNFTAWQSLLVILLTLELHTSVNKARLEFRDNINEYLSTLVVTGTTFTMISYMVVLIFHTQFEGLFNMPMRYINVLFLYLLAAPALSIFQVMNRVNLRYKLAISIILGTSIASIVFALLFTNVFPDRVFGRIVGYDSPRIAVCVTIWLYLFLKGRRVKPEYIKYALMYSVPLIAHLLSMNILGSSDRIMVRKMRSPEEAAVYGVGYSCAMIVTVLLNSVNQAMSPWLFDNLEAKSYEKIRKTNRYYVSVFTVIIMGLMLIAPEILYIMGGKKYIEAKNVLPPVFVGLIAMFLYTSYVNVEYYLKRSRTIASGTMMAAAINLALNAVFIPRFGYVAAACTTWFSYVCLLFFHYMAIRRLGYGKLYSNRVIFMWLGISSAFMVICVFIYRNDALRYILIALFAAAVAVFAFKKREMVRRLVRMLI